MSAPDPIRQLIEGCGANEADLRDVGITGDTARKWLATVKPRRLTRKSAVLVRPLGLPDTVALVPMNDIDRRYLRHDVYIRDEGLDGQIRLRATHLGWSDKGRIEIVRPIGQRWRIGSTAVIPGLLRRRPAITAEPDLIDNWPAPATLLELSELGAPIAVGLPLGYAPNATGGAPVVPAVVHVLLADLLAAAGTGGTLKEDVPML